MHRVEQLISELTTLFTNNWDNAERTKESAVQHDTYFYSRAPAFPVSLVRNLLLIESKRRSYAFNETFLPMFLCVLNILSVHVSSHHIAEA